MRTVFAGAVMGICETVSAQLLLAFCAAPARADSTVVSVGAVSFNSGNDFLNSVPAQPYWSALATGWSQTTFYSKVSTSAETGNIGWGQAYRMDQIGPGNALENQIAIANYSVNTFNSESMVNLFSGLNPGPGSYHCEFDVGPGQLNSTGWSAQDSLDLADSFAPGVALLNSLLANSDTSARAHAPAVSFFTSAEVPIGYLEFDVQETPVKSTVETSEPASVTPLLSGLLTLGVSRKRNIVGGAATT